MVDNQDNLTQTVVRSRCEIGTRNLTKGPNGKRKDVRETFVPLPGPEDDWTPPHRLPKQQDLS